MSNNGQLTVTIQSARLAINSWVFVIQSTLKCDKNQGMRIETAQVSESNQQPQFEPLRAKADRMSDGKHDDEPGD